MTKAAVKKKKWEKPSYKTLPFKNTLGGPDYYLGTEDIRYHS